MSKFLNVYNIAVATVRNQLHSEISGNTASIFLLLHHFKLSLFVSCVRWGRDQAETIDPKTVISPSPRFNHSPGRSKLNSTTSE
jgi:hypothetical protein